jgi:hypothetical protein
MTPSEPMAEKTNLREIAEKRTPFMIHCGDCKHEWAAFYLPLTADEAGMRLLDSAGKAPCPMCASAKTFVGSAK